MRHPESDGFAGMWTSVPTGFECVLQLLSLSLHSSMAYARSQRTGEWDTYMTNVAGINQWHDQPQMQSQGHPSQALHGGLHGA